MKLEEQIMASKFSTAAIVRRAYGPVRTGIGVLACRAVAPGLAAVAVAGLLAACAGHGGSGAAGGITHRGAAARGTVIATRKLPGIGTVLVDRAGKTLYSPQQEIHGPISCTGGCLAFWFPVPVAGSASLRAPSGVTGVLGSIHRPGGMTQLTYDGRPLYTFRLDQAPGQAHGNNFTDHFGGTSFTWHAITASGTSARTGQAGNPGGYSYQGGSPGY
jgi:predicted lipoprotein with Yx(FWY)xxD motif